MKKQKGMKKQKRGLNGEEQGSVIRPAYKLGQEIAKIISVGGLSLRVKDGEVAVSVYEQKDRTMQDFIVRSFDQTIKTANFPVLASIVGLAYEGGSPFQAEIYFINLARIIHVKLGMPFFDVYNPRLANFGIPIAVRGTISFQIQDYCEFIKLNQLHNFRLKDFQKQIQDTVISYVKDTIANAPSAHNIPVIQIESKTAKINNAMEYDIGERLKESFGILVSGVDIGVIEIDKTSEGYRQLMAVTKDVAAIRVETEAQDYVERLRIQREEGQYAMNKQAQTSNIGAFQVEKEAEVGVAGAQSLGQMGANGAGDVNLSGGGDGFNMAAVMASMAVGGVVGQNIAKAMNNMMGGINQQTTPSTVLSPIPVVVYHVAIIDQAAGPFDMLVLTQMVANGQ